MSGARSGSFRTALVPVLLFSLHAVPGQDAKSGRKAPQEDKSQFTFKIPVDVIVVSTTVTDKKGKPVLDLTADDFRIYEDGKAQPIHTFALESYKPVQQADMGGQKSAAKPAGEESPNFSQPRMFALVIDDVTSARELLNAAIEAAKKFVEQDLGPGDQVAILSASGRVQHPFTSDKQLLLAEIGSLHQKMDMRASLKSACPTLTDLQAQRIANDVKDGVSLEIAVRETMACAHLEEDPRIATNWVHAEAMTQYYEAQYRNHALLRNLRQYIRSLKHFEARKNIVLFSDGFLFEEVIYDLQDVVDQALRAGVVLNTVDIRGLYVPMLSASEGFSFLSSEILAAKERMASDDAYAQEDALNQLAHDTGGIFHHNSNDLHAGLKTISDRQAHYYVLTYAAPSQKADGHYHKIKLEVTRPGVELSYRKGYYAPKEQLSFEHRRKEDILEALQAPGNVNEIPIGLSYNSFQVDDSRYEVELVTRVDIRRMQFVEEESRRRNLISLVLVALDENDRYVDGLQKDVSFSLTSESYSELLNRGFASRVSIRVPPGRYKIKTVVRESVQSKMGSLTKAVEIP